MTYTLTMATEGIRIADDGVAEVSMTDARALLTRLIRKVRERAPAGAFTERGERTAYVVTPGFYNQAQLTRTIVDKLAEANPSLLGELGGAAFKDLYDS